jgi:hypothetical protein
LSPSKRLESVSISWRLFTGLPFATVRRAHARPGWHHAA